MGTKTEFRKATLSTKIAGNKRRVLPPLSAALFVCFLFVFSHAAGAANITGLTDLTQLRSALGRANAGDTLTLSGDPASGIIYFPVASLALKVDDSNLTIRGAGRSLAFEGRIGTRVEELLAGLSPDTRDSLAGNAQTLSGSWLKDAAGYLSGMTTINGRGGVRTPSDLNDKKWLKVADTITYSRTGLNLKNLRFTNVNAEYSITAEKNGIVNGLIGNVNASGTDASLGDITGNAFTDISVTLKGKYDNDYLAGGGVIGIRSTGETTLKNKSASARIGAISGNLFQGLNVTTTDQDGVLDSTSDSAYIEGGG